MNNPFKKIATQYNVSKLIKSRVLDDVNMIKFSFKLSDYFVKKNPKVLKEFYLKQEILEQNK